MLNSVPPPTRPAQTEDEAVEAIVRAGPGGAIVLAGIGAAVVLGLWLAFYFLVFLPRGGLQ
jgi:hypothetical protein